MFNSAYNTDGVLIRNVVLGLLDLLNRRVTIDQVISDTEVMKISIPFFYNNFGQERFLQDFYYRYGLDCDTTIYAEGNTDPVPRGIVHVDSIVINSGALTNKFVRATYAKPVMSDGQIVTQSFSAMVNPIPLQLQLSCEIRSNTALEAMKIIEAFIHFFYRAKAYTVEYRGFPVETRVGFSNEYSLDKPISFTYGDQNNISVKMPLEIETYLPVIDPTTEFNAAGMTTGGWGSSGVSGVSGYSAGFGIQTHLPGSPGHGQTVQGGDPGTQPPNNQPGNTPLDGTPAGVETPDETS